jgi:microcystin-dependent protein
MPWQTPKTDWTPADGVADSDLNRIEGNLATATSEPTADSLVKRDAAGRFKAADPAHPNDVATKGFAERIIAGGIPAGVIVMWSGNVENIPSGWALCNGQNGTPDLRDRFILGIGDEEQPGETGGNNELTLTVDHMPSHRHSFTTGSESKSHTHSVTGGSHSHTYTRTSYSNVSRAEGSYAAALVSTSTVSTSSTSHSHTVGNNSSSHTHSGNTAYVGGGQAIDIRPKYYKLAFIMKL